MCLAGLIAQSMNEELLRPQRLFRYFSPGYSHMFTEQRLWFAAASDFDDIFEVFPRYDVLVPHLLNMVLIKKYAFLPPEVDIPYEEFRRRTMPLRRQIMADCMEEYPEVLQEKVGLYYGIICFTERPDSLLMWGHYTDGHRGFVVEFDPEHELFSPRDF